MSQVESGLRGYLSISWAYSLFQKLIGADGFYRRIVNDYVAPHQADRILDIGCGPADILLHLPPGVEYYGFDTSATYIATARRRFGARGTFWADRVSRASLARLPKFDVVLASGVLHHLDDDEARDLFALARDALTPGGHLVTCDVCYVDGQSRASRFLASRDRGQNVRHPDGYRRLAETAFDRIRSTVLRGHLRLPYTTTVMECERP